MKKYLLILALICGPVYADDHAFCMNHAETAKAVMGMRQMGFPITYLSKGMENPVLRPQIMRAYQRPAWATDRMKEREKSEFESSEYLLCMSGDIEIIK
jgi:hypothetical protein